MTNQARPGRTDHTLTIAEEELSVHESDGSSDESARGIRVGLGHDTHRLAPGGPLVLGGLEIAHDQHLVGHSDADVLLHAVTDAILGAAALGDIGELFPNTTEENRDRDSAEMLRLAYEQVRARGWRVVNLDCIIFAERPKMSPYKGSIARRIAEILELTPSCVGVKAKTGEGVGIVGEEAAIVTQCVALLQGGDELQGG